MDPLIAKLERRFSPEFSRLLAKRINEIERNQWYDFYRDPESGLRDIIGNDGIKMRIAGLCEENRVEQDKP